MKRGTGLNQVSAKRKAENQKRERAKQVVRERARGRCEALTLAGSVEPTMRYCAGPWDFHEVLTRARGGSISDPENILHVCRRHHDWITDHPQEAHDLGLVAHSWEEAHSNAVVAGILRNLESRPAPRPTPSTALRAANVKPQPQPHQIHVRVLGAAPSPPPEAAGQGSVCATFVHPARPWTLNGERKMTPFRRAEKVREWRQAFQIIGHQGQRFEWADVEVRVYLRDMRGQDTVGAVSAYKAALDGLRDAKVIPDDSPQFIRSVTFRAPEKGTYDALELVLTGSPA